MKDDRRRRRITSRRLGQRKKVKLVPVEENMGIGRPGLSLVLDKSGRIFKLDEETLELAGPVGLLGGGLPCTDFEKLLAYRILPFSIKGRHKGLIIGDIGADIFRPEIRVFNEHGEFVKAGIGEFEFDRFGGGPALTIAGYALDVLQPAVLGFVTYITAPALDAADDLRSMFILPNSIPGVVGRRPMKTIERFVLWLAAILPSVIIGVFLAWRVDKDAKVVGLDRRARIWWLVGTIAFGLSAYITYRLTRAKATLVTCLNCGSGRRPDMENCHQCGSVWNVPELAPPNWRVVEE